MRDSENLELTPEEKQATLEELDKWQAVIDTPEKWTKGVYARDSRGRADVSSSKLAVCWCLAGASLKAGIFRATLVVDDLAKDKGFQNYVYFNDDPSTTHADVMALFERAKEKVRNAAQ